MDDEELEMKTSGDMEGYELSVTTAATAYLQVPPVRGVRKSARTVSVAPYDLEGYQGPDLILDLDGEGRLLGIEILY